MSKKSMMESKDSKLKSMIRQSQATMGDKSVTYIEDANFIDRMSDAGYMQMTQDEIMKREEEMEFLNQLKKIILFQR